MDFKSKITNNKLFDYLILSIIGYYTISIVPINIIFIIVTTKAYLLNNENLLNSFIIESIGLVCLTQLYIIKYYNNIVKREEFKIFYKKMCKSFPILDNYDPEMLFIDLLSCENNIINLEDNKISLEDKENNKISLEEPIEATEIPTVSDSTKMKKLFMAEMLKNPSLISNMTKMVGNIDPNILKKFANGMTQK